METVECPKCHGDGDIWDGSRGMSCSKCKGQGRILKSELHKPTCSKCGSVLACELFKGQYCPRCNDWC